MKEEEKNTGQIPENTNSEENIVENKEEVQDTPKVHEKVKKTFLTKLVDFVSDKFLKPSIITVTITAILGPVAISWVNESIENKNLQKEVIQTVLTYTSAADFSKPESIEKIGIIAKMVDENKSVFGLTFAETNKIINMLNQASNDVGIKNLDKKLNQAKENIKEMKAKISADSVIYANLIVEKESVNKQLERAKKKRSNVKINELENKLARIELDIKESTNNKGFYREQIKYWTTQKELLEKDIEAATNDLSNVLSKNRKNQELLKQEKDKLKSALAEKLSEMKIMADKISALQNKVQILQDSINAFKITKSKQIK